MMPIIPDYACERLWEQAEVRYQTKVSSTASGYAQKLPTYTTLGEKTVISDRNGTDQFREIRPLLFALNEAVTAHKLGEIDESSITPIKIGKKVLYEVYYKPIDNDLDSIYEREKKFYEQMASSPHGLIVLQKFNIIVNLHV